MLFQYRWKACAALFLCAGLLIGCLSGCDLFDSRAGYGDPPDPVQAGMETPGADLEPEDGPAQTVIPGRHEEKPDPARDDDPMQTDDPHAGDEPDPDGDPDGMTDPDETGGGEPDPDDDPEIEPDPVDAAVYGELPEGDRVEDSYFDDAVFIGDSVTMMLQYYTMRQRAETPGLLGSAVFLTAGSFSYRHALTAVTEESIHPSYNGAKMRVEDAISQIGAKKIYIMLGMNDISNRNYTVTMENIDTLVSRILEKNPDVKFYFESVTPRMANSEHSYLNNEIIRGFNTRLAQYCVDHEHYFVNVYAGVCDETGALPARYCSDPVSEGGNGMGIHFTYEGCAVWVDYLYTHTA